MVTDLDTALTTAAIVLVSAAVQSMTGFGFAVLAVPLLTLIWQPGDAIGISMVLSTVCVVLLWLQVRRVEQLPIIRGLFLAALAGLPVGLWVLAHIDIGMLRFAIGGVTLATVAMIGAGLVREAGAVAARTPHLAATIGAGFTAGLLTGSLSMPGPPVVMLLTQSGTAKGAYRATLTAFVVLIYPIALAAMLIGGLISTAALWQSLFQMPVLLLGFWFGNLLHGAASERSFSLMSLTLLAVAGVLCFVGR